MNLAARFSVRANELYSAQDQYFLGIVLINY